MALQSLTTATDRELMRQLGDRLRLLRRSQELTMLEAAARTGLSRRTVHRAEGGANPTLLTLLRLLRLYGRLEALAAFIPEPVVSPMAVLAERAAGKSRGKGRKNPTNGTSRA